jgi:RNA polymerase sigma-70 factor (ECF subfamily)
VIKAALFGHDRSMNEATLSMGETMPDAPGEAKTRLAAERRLKALVAGYYDFVWRALRRLGVGAGETDDAAQQVFLTASRKLDAIRPGSERPFLFQTALRVAADYRRTRRRRREADGADEVDGAELVDPRPATDELVELRRARAKLDAILDAMPLELRAVFVLFELEQTTMADISKLLGVPAGTVASRLRRARDVFYQRVDRQTEGQPLGGHEP